MSEQPGFGVVAIPEIRRFRRCINRFGGSGQEMPPGLGAGPRKSRHRLVFFPQRFVGLIRGIEADEYNLVIRPRIK